MYYDGPPGMLLDLVGPSPDGVDLVWYHPYTNAGQKADGSRQTFSDDLAEDRIRAMLRPYAYVDNNPVNYIDPSGLQKITPAACREACNQGKKSSEALCRQLCAMLKNCTCTGLDSLCSHLLRHRQKKLAEVCLITYNTICLCK